jgi:signal peptidase I
MRVLDRSLSRLPRPVRTLVDWAVAVSFAVVAVLAFQAEVAKPYRIPTASMEPTLHCAQPVTGCHGRISDRVIANRLVYRFQEPRRGDIVVFEPPAAVAKACPAEGPFVKRIVGLPDEAVSMRNGQVYVDGIRLNEPYLAAAYRGHGSGSWARVPGRSYFMLGDNREQSCDSRSWGVVPRDNIIGRAELRYWPPNRAGRPG